MMRETSVRTFSEYDAFHKICCRPLLKLASFAIASFLCCAHWLAGAYLYLNLADPRSREPPQRQTATTAADILPDGTYRRVRRTTSDSDQNFPEVPQLTVR
ncbi:MAG: hypothetical protein CM15mP68_5230 [Pseudomonadota bacterium]|nr:MAG: hypothetical protein CM15mP68_5230 [Pseudomonadota bacterium]